ncbi:MAG TPA: hypothetical protein DD671_18835 [Balneolaceae bacterium]|nr:hypothetical protein [Balneolaceae bacterium]
MAVQSSGQIAISDIATEFGGSQPHALSEYYGEGGVAASGQLKFSDFYGTSSITASDFIADLSSPTYRNYLESIGKYFVEVWIPELEKENTKISSVKNEATHRIEERVSKMWNFYLKKIA